MPFSYVVCKEHYRPGLMLMIDEESLGMDTTDGNVQLQDEWVWDVDRHLPIRRIDEAFLAMGHRANGLPRLRFEMLLEKAATML